MKTIKVFTVVAVIALLFVQNAIAQNIESKSLSGRVYYNPNILKGQLNNLTQELEKELPEARRRKIAEVEKEKGRPLTKEEIAEIDNDLKKAMDMAIAIKNGTVVAITMEFKSETEIVMKPDIKVNEEVLKAAGMGWAKRKAIKAALAVTPSEKSKYTVRDTVIYMYTGTGNKPEDRDTMTLSRDGRFLYGKMDESTPFKLTRIK